MSDNVININDVKGIIEKRKNEKKQKIETLLKHRKKFSLYYIELYSVIIKMMESIDYTFKEYDNEVKYEDGNYHGLTRDILIQIKIIKKFMFAYYDANNLVTATIPLNYAEVNHIIYALKLSPLIEVLDEYKKRIFSQHNTADEHIFMCTYLYSLFEEYDAEVDAGVDKIKPKDEAWRLMNEYSEKNRKDHESKLKEMREYYHGYKYALRIVEEDSYKDNADALFNIYYIENGTRYEDDMKELSKIHNNISKVSQIAIKKDHEKEESCRDYKFLAGWRITTAQEEGVGLVRKYLSSINDRIAFIDKENYQRGVNHREFLYEEIMSRISDFYHTSLQYEGVMDREKLCQIFESITG